MPPADARKLVAAEIMGGIYFEILQRIERRGYDVFTERVRVPKFVRARIALQIWALSQLSALGLTALAAHGAMSVDAIVIGGGVRRLQRRHGARRDGRARPGRSRRGPGSAAAPRPSPIPRPASASTTASTS